jgi:hypothetical protein
MPSVASTCICFPGTPDWTAISAIATVVSAFATVVLAFGVIIAWYQLRLQRKGNQVIETGKLLQEWNSDRLWLARSWLDEDADSWDIDRKRATRLYKLVAGLKTWRFRRLQDFVNDLIEEHARLAERIEIYIRKGAADESIIGDHIAYDVLMSYTTIQGVLQERATEDDLSYEGFRDLALRLQDYAKIHPFDADLRGRLVWANLPPLEYARGDKSKGYDKSLWRQIELELATLRDMLHPKSRSARDRKEWAKA